MIVGSTLYMMYINSLCVGGGIQKVFITTGIKLNIFLDKICLNPSCVTPINK